MAVCLVTGGAGFIGSHLVDALLAHGHSVRVLDDFSTGSLANLERVLHRIELVTGDVTDPRTAQAATQGVDLVFHQAALVPDSSDVNDLLASHYVCATGTLEILRAAMNAGVRRLIYGGGSCVYGNSRKLPVSENAAMQPLSPYAVAKLAGELYCQLFTRLYGFETVRLRYFNVFGPRQTCGGPAAQVIPLFLQALRAGRAPVIYGDGRQSRDFTYVEDVVQANLLAAEARRVAGKVYNIAFGCQTTLVDLVSCLSELLGQPIRPVHGSARPGDIRHSVADTSLAQKELGFCPWTSLKEGLRRCFAHVTTQERDPVSIVVRNGASLRPHPLGDLSAKGAQLRLQT